MKHSGPSGPSGSIHPRRRLRPSNVNRSVPPSCLTRATDTSTSATSPRRRHGRTARTGAWPATRSLYPALSRVAGGRIILDTLAVLRAGRYGVGVAGHGPNARNPDPGIRLVLEELRDLRVEMRADRQRDREERRQADGERRQADAERRQADEERR